MLTNKLVVSQITIGQLTKLSDGQFGVNNYYECDFF